MTSTPTSGSGGLGITILRVVVGGVFAAHGAQKLFALGVGGTAAFMEQIGVPAPGAAAVAVIAAELLGGVLLATGLFTRAVAAPLAVILLVAITAVHLPAGFFLPDGLEFALVMLAATVSLLLTGPGPLALDNLRGASEPARAAAGEGRREEGKRAAA